MDQKKSALGKGLSSLIPMGNRSEENKNYFLCKIDDIIANPNQPRKLFNKESIDELAASIEAKGIIQPLIVRKLGGGKYELIAGERRYRASKQIGLVEVPVVVKEIQENETLQLALIENIQRQDLNPIEEALAYKELLSCYQFTQDELAKQVGKDRSSIANSLRLLKLPDKIRNYLISNEISMGHARALLAIENKDLQLQIASDIVQNNLSVRDTENMIKKYKDGLTASLPETKKAGGENSARYYSLESRLKEHLQTMVKIKSNGKKCQIVMNFKTEDDMKNIVDKLLV